MHLTNFHFYNSKNYLYSKPVKGLSGCGVGYGFSFNGKENDNETQTQDYGMRIYDYRLGRFLSVDPLTKSFPMLSSYQFASNTPIQAIDLDGKEAFIATETKGTGHSFLVAKTADELIVYTYGRYGAVNMNQISGEGVLQKLTGTEAVDYINTELTRMDATFFKVSDVSPENVKKVVDNKYIAGQQSSEEGVEGSVIDEYDLFTSNCTIKSCDWLKESGTAVFNETVLGVQYKEDFVIPSSLQDYLNLENIDPTKKLSYGNVEMQQIVKNETAKLKLDGAGRAAEASGSGGNSSGKSANSSSSGSLTGRNTASSGSSSAGASSSSGGSSSSGAGASSSAVSKVKRK